MNRTITSLLSASALAGTVTLATAAAASADPDWDALAQCESGGNWHSTVGKFDGGIQFNPHTWHAYGGGQYAPSADQATREQQIAIGRKVLAKQGTGAWPACSAKTGWAHGAARAARTSGAARPVPQATRTEGHVSQHPARPQVQTVTVPRQAAPTLGVNPTIPAGGSEYTVVVGDTLTKLGGIFGVDWREIYRANGTVIEHPDWIFPGERLAIPAPQNSGHTTARAM